MSHRIRCFVAGLVISIGLGGCSTPDRVSAVPDDFFEQAIVTGMPGVRYFADVDPRPLIDDAFEALEREKAYLIKNGSDTLPPVNILAVSGGGDAGAFGAGLLVGWSDSGTRPSFKIVTGVSTGALTAPFAFLGPDYDDQLRKVYTSISPDEILEKRSVPDIFFGDSAADNEPLWNLVRQFINAEMMQEIAAEYDKGRLLLIATTNLDAQRPVIWNIGAIAKSGHPDALSLFQSILIASAAIPGAFPPVMIDVEAGGVRYQEMHVDGGTLSQVFIYPPSLNLEEVSRRYRVEDRERTLYVIRNARLDPEWANVDRWVVTIAGRAISSLIQSQGLGDLYRIYLTAERDKVDFNLAHIPSSFDAEHPEEFDNEFMNKLFDLGYAMAIDGYPWEKYPPGFNPG